MAQFELFVSKADFKFSCAHFIIHEGGRERLHGHNYQLSVRILGGDTLCSDGYLIDFGQVKKEVRNLCKDINESFICPVKSPHLRITRADDTVCLDCIDGSRFVFPRQDCTLLPLFHSSVEELAHYFWFTLVERLGLETLLSKGVTILEIGIEETQNQRACYRRHLPLNIDELNTIRESPIRNVPQLCFGDSS